MTVSEAEAVAEEVHSRISGNARIIWGATIDPSIDRRLRVMIVVTGVKSKQILGPGGEQKGHEIGIDFIK